MSTEFNEGFELIETIKDDAHKFFEKGNAAAAVRVRKGLSNLKKWAQEQRNNIQKLKNEKKEAKNSGGAKKKASKKKSSKKK